MSCLDAGDTLPSAALTCDNCLPPAYYTASSACPQSYCAAWSPFASKLEALQQTVNLSLRPGLHCIVSSQNAQAHCNDVCDSNAPTNRTVLHSHARNRQATHAQTTCEDEVITYLLFSPAGAMSATLACLSTSQFTYRAVETSTLTR